VPAPQPQLTAAEKERKEFNDTYMKVARARQKFIIDFQVEQIAKKKALESQAGKLSRCWSFLKKVFGILIVLAILFALLRPVIYRKLGWDLTKPVPDVEPTEGFEDYT
jgi:hypothetical protein